MLTPLSPTHYSHSGGQFVIIASKYNSQYVNAMLDAAQQTLQEAGAEAVEVIRVPGSYEIPIAAAAVAKNRLTRPAAIICLGVILRGETTHAGHIADAVTGALMQIQLTHGVPVIHEVLLLENEKQAELRCLLNEHNRGTEAAQTALEMMGVMRKITSQSEAE